MVSDKKNKVSTIGHDELGTWLELGQLADFLFLIFCFSTMFF